MSIQAHPVLNQLSAFGHGKSTEAEDSEIAAHLDTCIDCQRVVDTQPDDAVVSLLRNVITRSPGQISTAIDTWLPTELANHPRYRIVGWLGAGGMGVVFEAEHRLMQRRVAIKVISKTLTTNRGPVERFKKLSLIHISFESYFSIDLFFGGHKTRDAPIVFAGA